MLTKSNLSDKMCLKIQTTEVIKMFQYNKLLGRMTEKKVTQKRAAKACQQEYRIVVPVTFGPKTTNFVCQNIEHQDKFRKFQLL